MNIPYIMIRCLLFTIIIELIIALLLKVRSKGDILNVILVNIVTNPIVVIVPVFMYIHFGYYPQIISLIVLEILTVLVEGFIYKKTLDYKKINPFLLALILNVFSYLVGEIINHL